MKLTPGELAEQFSNLNKSDFQKFWMHVLFLWNDEESDLDAQWFYYPQGARPAIGTVISAMHSAVYSGMANDTPLSSMPQRAQDGPAQ